MSDTLTAVEAAKMLGVTSQTIRRWLKDGAVSYIHTPGGRYLIPASEVVRLATPIPAKGVAGDDERQDAPPKALPKPMF